jgi:hypothetical protein
VVLERAVVEVLVAVGEVDAEHLREPTGLGEDGFDLRAREVAAERDAEGAELRIPLQLRALDGEVLDAAPPLLEADVADA